MFWLDMVNPWNHAARNRQVECNVKQCKNCGEIPNRFERHECRRRTFLIWVGDLIHTVSSYALRWKCPVCGATFTMLPPFALPGKRYVKETIFALGKAYLEDAKPNDADKRTSYRDLVAEAGYASKDETIDERRPSHTRVWYWIRDLGQMEERLRTAKRLIRAKDPSSKAVGRIPVIAPCKYRTQRRRELLEAAWSLLRISSEWVRLFKISLPPKFGTVGF